MRLLIITYALDEDDPVLAWQRRVVIELSERVSEITVLTERTSADPLPANVRVVLLPHRPFKVPRRLGGGFLAGPRVFKELQRDRPDACFVHMASEWVYRVGWVFRALQIPVVLWYAHGTTTRRLRLAVGFADRVVTSTSEGLRVVTEKKRVIGQGIDLERFPLRSDTGRRNVILYVGRLSSRKRVMRLVEVLAAVRRLSPEEDFHLRVVGASITAADRGYALQLEEHARQLGVRGAVEIVGSVRHDELHTQYEDVFVHLNLSDTGSMDKTLMEALACGTPIITSNIAFKELLAGHPEMFVTTTDPEEVARRVLLLRAGPETPRAELRQMVVQGHDIATYADRVLAEINDVLAKRGGRVEMTRILLVTNIFPPIVGGPSTFIDTLAHHLSASGHGITVICTSDGRHHDSDATRPFRVLRCDFTNRYRYEFEVRAVLTRELLRHNNVLVNGLESYVEPIARRLRRRYVLKVVGDPVWEQARNLGLTAQTFDEFQAGRRSHALLDAIEARRGRWLALAEHVVTPSDYLSDVVAGWGVERDRLVTIANGVPAHTSAGPRRRRDPSSPLEVTFVGRLTNWKGVETVLIAISSLPNVRLSIIGDGPEAPLLRTLATQLGVDDRARFLGRSSHAEVDAHLALTHVLVLPSCYEGLSHTLLEACQAGAVPVTSDIGGNRAVVEHGVNGLLVPYADVAALAATLARLQHDDQLRLALSEGARSTASRFSFERAASRYIELLS